MGKGGAKVEVTKYFMADHFGICMGADAMTKIIVKEKEAWSGEVTTQTAFVADKDQLFGGPKKEGGFEGVIYWLPGASDQVLPDVLAQKLGRSGGADAPGYRGIASIFVTGPSGTAFSGYSGWTESIKGRAGAYWSANNPYLPPVWVQVRRAPVGLNPAYALIPNPNLASVGSTPAVFVGGKVDLAYGEAGPPFPQPPLTITLDSLTGGGGSEATGGHYVLICQVAYGAVDFAEFGADESADYTTLAEVYHNPGYIGGLGQLTMWVGGKFIGASEDSVTLQRGSTNAGAAVMTAIRVYSGVHPTSPMDVAVETATNNDDSPDADPITPVTQGALAVIFGAISATNVPTPFSDPGDLDNFQSDCSNTVADIVIGGGELAWDGVGAIDPVEWNQFGAEFAASISVSLALRPGSGGADANPAHIIYEALTNTDWGMGSPTAAIDTETFEEAGVTLWSEGFGLSMIWTRQSSIQDFVQQVLDHINAVVFVDPGTGLLTLKLIRGDYDPDTLPELTPDNADLTNFGRKLFGEITNEIIVSWTNPATEQEETTPPAQDLASIAAQGLVSDGRNYYGVRYAAKAVELSWRELRSAGTPLASCEAEVDRSQYLLRPASVVKLTWPEYGLDAVVFRVMSVDYGRPGDPSIKLSLMEDVFGLDYGAYDTPPSSSWEDPSEDPEPLTIEQIITLPLFFAANSPAAEFIDTPEYPEVVAGILATTTQADAYAYDLWDEVTLSNGSLEWQELATLNIIGHAALVDALDAEITTTGVSFATQIGTTNPTLAGFLIIGDDDEDGNEIAQIDAIASDYTLRRGLLDTVPRAWPAGTPVWFLDDSTLYEDSTVRASGETVDYKLLTKTSKGTLDLADASLVSHDMTDRPWLPNRPANVQVAGILFNSVTTPVDMTSRADPWVTISWVNRNRLSEDSQVLAWDDATVTPETGQTTTVDVFAQDGTTLLASHTALSGTSYDVPDASFGAEQIVLLKPKASRTDADGTFVSLQAHGIWVQIAPLMVTEAGELLVTEGGDNVVEE